MRKLQDGDIQDIMKILDGKIPGKSINKLISKIYFYSLYYDHGDSQYNKPTLTKLLTLLLVFGGIIAFIVLPIFFGKNVSIEDIKQTDMQERIELGGIPTLQNFELDVSLENKIGEGGENNQYIVLKDSIKGEILGSADLKNGFGKLITTAIGDYRLENTEDILQANVASLKEDQINEIKDLISNNITVNQYIPEFSSIDYGVDEIINGMN